MAVPCDAVGEAIAGKADPIPGGDARPHARLAGAAQVPKDRRIYDAFPCPDRTKTPNAEAHRLAREDFWTPADRLIAPARGGW